MIAYLYSPSELAWFMKAVTGGNECLKRVLGDDIPEPDEESVIRSLMDKGFLNAGGTDPVQTFMMRQAAGAVGYTESGGGKVHIFECSRMIMVFIRDKRSSNIKVIPFENAASAKAALEENGTEGLLE